MILHTDDYRERVLGCWMGKNIGGTLGAPMEWKRQLNDVTFYQQDLKGEPLPNDDLDIQLLWLLALEEKGIDIDARVLAEYYLSFLTPHWAEYGISKTHMRAGLPAPLCSAYENCFKDSCGSYIRSEIWACLAPGCPEVATRYAYEDSILDHGNGEGLYAEIFVAAMESAAFAFAGTPATAEADANRLIDIGLSYIPADCGVARAVRRVRECRRDGLSWQEARDTTLRECRGGTLPFGSICQEDIDKGFREGPIGYDVPSNIAMLLIGWLYGEGDFDRTICITVNCGEDTDCTAATIGSLWGLLYGLDGIPEKWKAPIGTGIKTIVLDICDLNGVPGDIYDLTRRVERLARAVTLLKCPGVTLSDTQATDLSGCTDESLMARCPAKTLYDNLLGPVFRGDMFDVAVSYPDGPYITDGQPAAVEVRILNKHAHALPLCLKWYADPEYVIAPHRTGRFFKGKWWTDEGYVHRFTITAEQVPAGLCRFVLELTVEGRPTVMLIPIVLSNRNLFVP